METYTFLREFADSWVLLALILFYIGTIAWAFRPGARATHEEISRIPLRDDGFPEDGPCQSENTDTRR
ncbi:MAG: cbb3-type cytochrome c oxidase subunit 3 [Rhodobacteraceae bacterium]|nr:cbb3-type cytochrome c oxidase subunit 3 [Paracoccaceae bacterium]